MTFDIQPHIVDDVLHPLRDGIRVLRLSGPSQAQQAPLPVVDPGKPVAVAVEELDRAGQFSRADTDVIVGKQLLDVLINVEEVVAAPDR